MIAPQSGWKEAFRKRATAQRKEAHASQPLAGERAASQFMHHIAPPPTAVVAIYHPYGSELDTGPLAEKLWAQGNELCLPVVLKKNAPVIFRTYTADIPLVNGAFGIMAPADTAPEIVPDIIIVPLLGFMRNGGRLGMGGGFYDRTLEKLRAEKEIKAIAYAYAGQELDKFPVEKHDEPMDAIVTDLEIIRF